MSAWTEGYVADIPYALGFYRETVPAHIAFAAACVGKHPGLALRPRHVLELGIGMGLGFVINAAANPGTHFEGIDFNPLHVSHAQGLIDDADITNASLREASFQDLAQEAREGQHDVDLMILHGILTWVSSEAHEAIVEIARKRLKPGGLLYVSYNCMPGWAPVLPMQRLMRENAKRMAGRSDQQTASGLVLIHDLIAEGANYFKANPTLEIRLGRIKDLDKGYLSHEYLNANWFIFHFADVAEMFSRSKLTFVGSATLIENMDGIGIPEAMRTRIGTETDPIFRETLRDIASNKQFRRDIYGRGISSPNPSEQNAILSALRFTLAVPRASVSYKIASPVGDLEGDSQVYGAIADLLDGRTASFAEIAALPVFAKGGASTALQAMAVFVHSGQMLPVPSIEPDVQPAQRLNRLIALKVLQGRVYSFLATPKAGSGIQVSHSEMLIFAAIIQKGEQSASDVTDFVLQTIDRLGIRWLKDGTPLIDQHEKKATIRAEVEKFCQDKLPQWHILGVV